MLQTFETKGTPPPSHPLLLGISARKAQGTVNVGKKKISTDLLFFSSVVYNNNIFETTYMHNNGISETNLGTCVQDARRPFKIILQKKTQ